MDNRFSESLEAMTTDKPEVAYVRGRVDKTLKTRFKALCVLQDRDMDEVLGELVDAWVTSNENAKSNKKRA